MLTAVTCKTSVDSVLVGVEVKVAVADGVMLAVTVAAGVLVAVGVGVSVDEGVGVLTQAAAVGAVDSCLVQRKPAPAPVSANTLPSTTNQRFIVYSSAYSSISRDQPGSVVAASSAVS